MNKISRIALKALLWIIGSLIALFLLLVMLLRMPSVQNFVLGKVTNYLETKIGTPVQIGYINIAFPKKLVLEDIYFEDQTKDTLLAGEKLIVDIDMLKLLKNTVEIQQLELEGITAKINRTLPDSSFNFNYIIKAFATEQESTLADADTSSALVFDIKDVYLKRINFTYHDDVIGTSAAVKLQDLSTTINTFELTNNMAFGFPKLTVDGLTATVKQWATATEGDGPRASDFGIEDPTVAAASLLPNISLRDINLYNIAIKYENQASAMDTKFNIKELIAKINSLDLNKEKVSIQEIALDEPHVELLFGRSTVLPAAPKDSSSSSNASSPINWVVSADKITLNKSNIVYKDDNQARTKGFDYGHIHITDLLANLENIYYASDSISGSLKAFSAEDHSGLAIKKLEGDFHYSDTGAEISNLIAQTANTTLRDYIKISYPSLAALSQNPNAVQVDANIDQSTIDMKDIRLFAPDLETMDVMKPLLTKKFFVDGQIKGSLDNLSIPHLEFKTLQKTHLIARAQIKGLPDMDRMRIDLTLKKFTTGRQDLNQLIAQSLMPDSLQLPNNISLAGTLQGGMQGIDANLSLITEKGNATVNGNLQMGRDTTYDAYVAIDNFDLGHLLKQDSILGLIHAEATVKGRGLNPKTMVADVAGTLNRLDAMGYAYKNIAVDMRADAGDIKASINSPDTNIQMNLEVAADMRGRYPQLKALLKIDSINFQNLNLMEDNMRYHGTISADFSTADLDYLNGEIVVSNSSIAYNNDRYTLDSIQLVSTADSSRNLILLHSAFLNAHLVGKYKLTELGASMQDILQMYYNPKGVPPKKLDYSAQNFEFSAQVNNSKFIKDFFPKLEELQDITLDGTFNSETKNIMAKLLAPRIRYDGMFVENVGLDITTFDSTLYYSALISTIKINTIELVNTVFSGSVVENNADFGLWIKDKLDKERYHLGARMGVTDNNYTLRFHEDGLMLNYESWDINPLNTLSFGKDGIRAQDFQLKNKNQELIVQSQDSSYNAPIDLTFNNFRIETFSKMLESETLNLGGGIHGSATLSRLESSPVFVSDLKIQKFYFGRDTIGDVLVKVNNVKENTYSADVRITENGNDVQLIGDVISPPTGATTVDATLMLKPMALKTVQAFSMGYLQDSRGDLAGELKITGTTDAPRINGSLLFNQAKINVAMLNADLLMDQQTIHFNNEGIQFKQFEIRDLKNNVAKLNGNIRTQTYTDFLFNLNLTTDDFAVVNSTREDNDLFFGKLFVTSNIRISGTMDEPKIDGNVKANENTDFVFIVPNDDPGVANRDGVVRFVDRSDTAGTNVFARLDSLTTTSKLSGFDMTLNLTTDRAAKFKVILDEGTQDALTIQGVAELNTTIDASDKITMSGTFTVENGNYTFSFGPISKDFSFEKGSSITWNGDPLDARLDITALHKIRVSTLELVQSQIGSESQNLYKQRIPFDVKLILTDELFKPQINFDIELDENNAIASQDVVSKVNIALSNIRDNPAELNKQVFSLIALGRFMSSNPFESLSGGGAESFARSTVSSFLSSQLNNLASNLITGVELDFNLQSEEDYLTGSAQTRTDLNVGISKMLFDDRLKITIGSNFEVEGNTRPGENATNIAGDISLEYQLSKDGRYFARVYRKNQYQATLQGQFVETGIGFIVNMSYDRFRELFMNSKALETYYDTESKGFRRRFDVDRMEVDSAYRDSIRLIIRDSLMTHSPEFRKRIQEREKEQLKKKDSEHKQQQSMPKDSIAKANSAIRIKEDERTENEK